MFTNPDYKRLCIKVVEQVLWLVVTSYNWAESKTSLWNMRSTPPPHGVRNAYTYYRLASLTSVCASLATRNILQTGSSTILTCAILCQGKISKDLVCSKESCDQRAARGSKIMYNVEFFSKLDGTQIQACITKVLSTRWHSGLWKHA